MPSRNFFSEKTVLMKTIPKVHLCLVIFAFLGIPITIQAQSSTIVSLSHPGIYHTISSLQARGHLLELTPDRLPYSISDIELALQKIDRSLIQSFEQVWIEDLQLELNKISLSKRLQTNTASSNALHLQLATGIEGTNTRRRDLYRPLNQDLYAWPFAHVAGTYSVGNWSIHTRVQFDYYYDKDPDAIDAVNRLYSRNEESYLGYQNELVSFYLGRMERHWGLFEEPAGLLSTNPRTFDQAYFTLGSSKLSISLLYGMLDGMNGDSTFTGQTRFDEVSFNRFVGMKRIDWRVTDALRLSFRESIIHSGRNATPDIRYLMPGSFYFFTEAAAPYDDQQNLLMGFSGIYQKKGWTLHSEFVLDDLIFNRSKRGLNEKSNFAHSFFVRYALANKPVNVTLRTQLATYQVYNTDYPETRYLYLGRGLASQNTDFLFVELRSTIHGTDIWEGWSLTPYIGALQQGEQKINQSFAPKRDSGITLPLALTGTVEKTIRMGLFLRFQRTSLIWAETDLGLNSTQNLNHLEGASEMSFRGTLRIAVKLDALLSVR